MTIRSDTPLNDYSAYRSGDRFYVVIPKANANSVPRGASGRGFSDMQVQQRGNDVVLSYKLQPGAKPRVNQRFDRLDVVFDTAEGATAQTPPQNTTRTQEAANTPRGNDTPQTNPNPRQTTPQTPDDTRPATNDPARASVQTPNAAVPGASTLPSATQTPLDASAPLPTDSPLAEASPTPADAGSQQIAQTQQPSAPVPITTTNPSAASPSSGSFAAAVLNNWPAIIGVLLLAGMVLFVLAQRSAARRGTTRDAAVATATNTTTTLKETPKLKTATVEKTTTTATTPVVVAPVTKKEKKDKKDKKKGSATPTSVASVTPTAPEIAAKTTATTAPVVPTKQEADEREKAGTEKLPAAAQASTQTIAPADSAAPDKTPAAPVVSEAKQVDVEPLAPVADLPAVSLAQAAAEPPEARKSLLDEQVTSEITPVIAVDAERVQVEIKRLLDGQAYDKRVLGGADMMSRQMIAAELLAALAGRNAERKQRASAAFVEQGFFNETAHDLHFAGAPAERASAARSLGLLGDRIATSHLVAALADQTMEVRRACVEALAEVRDPKAVAPLKSLLEREKELKVKVPRKIIERAIEACERGAEELPAPTATAVAITPFEIPSETTATTDEETPTLVAQETAVVVAETA
ncbi:MAG TPA: HEAT repeat domain-containing protein, partial [Pyrinomonadaceae bacterium]